MQPGSPSTATPALPESTPEAQPAVTPAPAVQEPKKAPEIKTLDLANSDTDTKSGALHPEHRPHAFVIMPFGKKKGGDGSPYDFNVIIELWPPEQASLEDTVRLEQQWAEKSVPYLRQYIPN